MAIPQYQLLEHYGDELANKAGTLQYANRQEQDMMTLSAVLSTGKTSTPNIISLNGQRYVRATVDTDNEELPAQALIARDYSRIKWIEKLTKQYVKDRLTEQSLQQFYLTQATELLDGSGDARVLHSVVNFFSEQLRFDKVNQDRGGLLMLLPMSAAQCDSSCRYQHALLFLRKHKWSETSMRQFLNLRSTRVPIKDMIYNFLPSIEWAATGKAQAPLLHSK